MLTAVILCVLLGALLLVISIRLRNASGLPPGKPIYSDTNMPGKALEQPLYSAELKLVGKPDYLIEDGEQIIPVEVKSAPSPIAPYDSHIYQLGAYGLLVEAVYKKQPSYGIIRYRDRTFRVDFSTALREKTTDLLREMQSKQRAKSVSRSHEDANRCRRCGYRQICTDRLDQGQ